MIVSKIYFVEKNPKNNLFIDFINILYLIIWYDIMLKNNIVDFNENTIINIYYIFILLLNFIDIINKITQKNMK